MIGTALTALLLREGFEAAHISRTEDLTGTVKVYGWDSITPGSSAFAKEKAREALGDTRAVIHLAGAGIADSRWTEARKRVIIDSRVKTAEAVRSACEATGIWPEAFISASGINYYGSVTEEKIFEESDPPAASFIGRCCVLWEEAATGFAPHARTVMLRTGVVLSPEGGALPKIAAPVKSGVGAPLGSGRQWMPYIHTDDLCRMYLHAVRNDDVSGPYNAVNGDHLTNKDLTRAIADVLGKPLWLPNVPGFILKAALGELSEVLLEGSRASAEKMRGTGFDFRFPEIQSALKDIYG